MLLTSPSNLAVLSSVTTNLSALMNFPAPDVPKVIVVEPRVEVSASAAVPLITPPEPDSALAWFWSLPPALIFTTPAITLIPVPIWVVTTMLEEAFDLLAPTASRPPCLPITSAYCTRLEAAFMVKRPLALRL